tara:strand:- start:38 stop:811 length:774 start_codon:yes stop_codon:yes gene_type:complete
MFFLPTFLIYSFAAHLIFFFIVKVDFKERPDFKEKSVSISMVEKKLSNPTEKKQNISSAPSKKKIKETKKPIEKVVNNKTKIKKKPIEKITKKKPEIKKELTKNLDNFDDMLKNLAEEELINKDKSNQNKDFEKTLEKTVNEQLISAEKNSQKGELKEIISLINQQINNNWSRPPGIQTSQNLYVKLIIYLNSNGDVIDIKVPNETKEKIKKNIYLKPYLDSAIRAIKKSSPFEGLKKSRYNIWKTIIINFKPREAT